MPAGAAAGLAAAGALAFPVWMLSCSTLPESASVIRLSCDRFMSNVPLERWGKPEEIGKLARFLCSDDAGYITGTDILIDGGWTAH